MIYVYELRARERGTWPDRQWEILKDRPISWLIAAFDDTPANDSKVQAEYGDETEFAIKRAAA